jgi:hypothetical protein
MVKEYEEGLYAISQITGELVIRASDLRSRSGESFEAQPWNPVENRVRVGHSLRAPIAAQPVFSPEYMVLPIGRQRLSACAISE